MTRPFLPIYTCKYYTHIYLYIHTYPHTGYMYVNIYTSLTRSRVQTHIDHNYDSWTAFLCVCICVYIYCIHIYAHTSVYTPRYTPIYRSHILTLTGSSYPMCVPQTLLFPHPCLSPLLLFNSSTCSGSYRRSGGGPAYIYGIVSMYTCTWNSLTERSPALSSYCHRFTYI